VGVFVGIEAHTSLEVFQAHEKSENLKAFLDNYEQWKAAEV
jgi:hypothetical protein